MTYFFLFLNILLLISGQILWKTGIKKTSFSFSIPYLFKLFLNPYIFSGVILYVFATIIWFYLLSKEDLSMIYPMQSLCYLGASLAGLFIFKEQIPSTRWLGIIFIVFGAFLVSMK